MQNIFKRYEKKYLVSTEQYAKLNDVLLKHMLPDKYGEYLVQNLYYDTENWEVIQASILKPLYKEKMRLRCYGIPDKSSDYFLELKKKFKGIVYKRRIIIPFEKSEKSNIKNIVSDEFSHASQIAREMDYYFKTNPVSEKIFISYLRQAFSGAEDKELRVTFDTDIRFRLDDLNFFAPEKGRVILPQEYKLMEIKTLGAMPLWLAHALSENEIFPSSFSKFGKCYTDFILKTVSENAEKTERKVKVSA